jgi:hypothetical protein
MPRYGEIRGVNYNYLRLQGRGTATSVLMKKWVKKGKESLKL